MYEELVEKLVEVDEAATPERIVEAVAAEVGDQLALIDFEGKVTEFSRPESHIDVLKKNSSISDNAAEYWISVHDRSLTLRFYSQPTVRQISAISKLMNSSPVPLEVLALDVGDEYREIEPFPKNWSAVVRKLWGERGLIDEAGYMGVTEAGWIHPNGVIEEIPSYVMGDHDKDAFEKMYPGETYSVSRDPTEAYIQYLELGHIRYMQSHRGFNIEVGKKPTESQMRAIRKGIEENEAGEFYFSTRLAGGYVKDGRSWQEFREVVSKLS